MPEMKIVVTGGGGFLGLRLARALLARGKLTAPDGAERAITRIVLLDAAYPVAPPVDARLEAVTGDIADAVALARAVAPDTASVFHLAAVVSGAAEADFDLGMRVNLEGTRLLLERLRACERPPRVVFASSVAAFGGTLPEVLDDSTTPNPQTSYGTQKVIGEYLLADYSRKGYLDGRALRLPTIVVRPGKPNAAASSFASGILREPLNDERSDCPVGPETAVWLLSPRRAVEAFVHAHEQPAAAWEANRVLNLPGITVSVAGMLEALARIAGQEAAKRVRWKPDPRIQAIVRTWPTRFDTPRALALGFRADPDIETVIRDHIADEGIRVS
jgi:nucleoside-diphosphate-sugar epimerase